MNRIVERLRAEDGVTLHELVVVISLLGVMSAAFSLTFSSAIKHSNEVQRQSVMQTETRAALDAMARELRQAYSGTTSSPIESVAASGTPAITFTTPDRDCSGSTCAFHLRRVSYRLTGGALQRAAYTSSDNDGAPWSWPSGSPPSNWVTLVSGVTNAGPFTFLDGNGATTTTAASVRTVKASLSVATLTNSASSYTYAIGASLRTSP
jgi:type II secretory pathway component PulJ